jgi:tetratricopeptide (TPR) repeat protein
LKHKIKIVVSSIFLLLIVGCSAKKDGFLNRGYHSIATKYNVLYNGNKAFEAGLEQLNSNYEDDFSKQLPVEPLKVERLGLPGMEGDVDNSPKEFERAEEKAVKAIQKHSMLIAREERNNQIDDAYLLLGKSRYYSKRFVPALEAFNYVINNYPTAELISETKIWQAKTYIRLRNEEQAIQNLNQLLKSLKLPKSIVEDANTALAMAYVALNDADNALKHLKLATETSNNKEQTARNLFIIGQIENNKGAYNESKNAFDQVVNLNKAPYKYKIHAKIENLKNRAEGDTEKTKREIESLIADTDNKKFLDKLYFQLGDFEKIENTENAINYYKKSLEYSQGNNLQKELSYEAAGNYYFDKAQFETAGFYYDSVLNIASDENSKRIRKLNRKRNGLNEFMHFDNIAKTTDSILSLVEMTSEERTTFFTEYIEKLKATEEKSKEKVTTGNSFFGAFGKKKNESKSGKWYFYNVQTMGFGEQEFKKVWGNRPLEDNWRLSDRTQMTFQGQNKEAETVLNVSDEEKYDIDFYLGSIPTNSSEIDSLRINRNEAFFELGVIYKQQFDEQELAKVIFEKLFKLNAIASMEVQAKYHLYEIYLENNTEKANDLKQDIITNFSDSKYAKIIQNPELYLKEVDENVVEKYYATVFNEYKMEQFDSVIQKSNEAIGKYNGQPIIPKFELLKAYAIGKKEGKDAFLKALDNVAMNYPNTEEGKKAEEVISIIKAKI